MDRKYFYNKKSVIVSILLILLLVVVGIYLFAGMMTGGGFIGGRMMGGGMMMGGGFSGGSDAYYGSNPKGYKLFRADGCIRCHTINGYGGTMGPDLSHIGSKRSFSWIATQIAYPSAHFKRGSMATINGKTYPAIMPNYEHMPKSQVITISKYLESLK